MTLGFLLLFLRRGISRTLFGNRMPSSPAKVYRAQGRPWQRIHAKAGGWVVPALPFERQAVSGM
jgi:hypothetical protein